MAYISIQPEIIIDGQAVADFEQDAFITKDELADIHMTVDSTEIAIFRGQQTLTFKSPDVLSKLQRRMIMAKLNSEFAHEHKNIENDQFIMTCIYLELLSDIDIDILYNDVMARLSAFSAIHCKTIGIVSHFYEFNDRSCETFCRPHIHVIYYNDDINALSNYLLEHE